MNKKVPPNGIFVKGVAAYVESLKILRKHSFVIMPSKKSFYLDGDQEISVEVFEGIHIVPLLKNKFRQNKSLDSRTNFY